MPLSFWERSEESSAMYKSAEQERRRYFTAFNMTKKEDWRFTHVQKLPLRTAGG